jgi:hypothetical protein
VLRLIPVPLCLLLVLAGCSTTKPIITRDFRSELRSSREALQITTVDGDTFRLGPNSEIRFLLHTGEATPWIRGRHLWRSELGLSWKEGDGIIFIGWDEIRGAEVQNLSGGKTFGAIALAAIIVGVVVVLVVASAKGGKGGKVGGSSRGTRIGGLGGSARAVSPIRGRRLARRRVIRHRGGVHLHIPIIIATTHHTSPAPPPPPPPPRDGPPPPAPAPPPSTAPPPTAPPPSGGVVEIHGAPPAPGKQPHVATAVATAPASTAARKPLPAVPLFSGSLRRRSVIQLIGSAGAGTELARFQGYTGSLTAGIRLRDLIEIGGGLRHTIEPLRSDLRGERDFSLVGFGRLGLHLWLDDEHRFAIPLSVDAGAGHNVRFHLRVNYGLRFAPLRNLWIGLMPFNTSYTDFTSGPFDGSSRWSFPSTLEVGFSF